MKAKALVILLCISIPVFAQQKKNLTKTATLKMPVHKVAINASLTWIPKLRLYVSAYMGNASYPMVIIRENGALISDDTLKVGADIRGLWYNGFKNQIQANLYGEGGWVGWKLSSESITLEMNQIFDESTQPDDNCVGFYDANTDIVYFLYGSAVYDFDATTGAGNNNETNLYIGYTPQELTADKTIIQNFVNSDIEQGYYNTTNIVLTRDRENVLFGVLNTGQKTIELYSKKTGLLQTILALPADTPALPDKFNFTYCNGKFWIYFAQLNAWMGFEDMTNSLPANH